MAENKEQWKDFYNAEKELFYFLNNACECLHSIGVNNNEPEILKYIEYETPSRAILERPPRFIHWIGRLKSSAAELTYRENVSLVLDKYREAVGKKFTHYPVRFPEFYTKVEQINVSSSSAYSSRALDDGDLLRLKTIEYKTKSQLNDAIKLLTDDIKTLTGGGYIGAFVTTIADLRTVGVALEIPAQSIIKKTAGGKIQVREYTGQQYRALVRRAGHTKGDRKKLGLMVLSNDSPADIYFSVPQALRKHSYAAAGIPIDLKIATDVQLWIK